MFTSRAEYRILLRQDNADTRLTPLSHSLGLASNGRMQQLEQKQSSIKAWRKRIGKESVDPAAVNPYLEGLGSTPLKQKIKADQLLSRPHVHLKDLMFHVEPLQSAMESEAPNRYVLEQVEILTKYEGYIQKEQENLKKRSSSNTIGGAITYESPCSCFSSPFSSSPNHLKLMTNRITSSDFLKVTYGSLWFHIVL